jgi:rod shape-determining protein MreD
MTVQWRWIGLLAGFFVAFVLEGTLFYWFLPADWTLRVSPRLVMIGLVFTAVFMNRYAALALGIVFGFLHDVMYYGHMLGVHTFAMGLVGYGAGLFFQRRFVSFSYLLMVCALSLLAADTIVELIYRLFRVVSAPLEWSLIHHILPSLMFNLFLFVLVYVPVRQWMEKGAEKENAEEEANG